MQITGDTNHRKFEDEYNTHEEEHDTGEHDRNTDKDKQNSYYTIPILVRLLHNATLLLWYAYILLIE